MTSKLSKPPNTQRNFTTCWGELDYLCKKMHFWLYTRKQRTRAQRYLERLASVLSTLPDNNLAILREEGLALLHELKGQSKDAIIHRKREIHLMERLHKDARSPRYSAATRAYLLQDRGEADLRERRAILEKLKDDSKPNAPEHSRLLAAKH
jgi:hypothetical protein